jgi:MIP family channel proteins
MANGSVPSSFLDNHEKPMEVKIPLINPSENPESSSNNGTLQAVVNIINKAASSSTIEKIAGNYNPSSDQPFVRSPHKESKILTTSNKLFPVAELKTLTFYQSLLSEFIGTLLLTLVCTSPGLQITSKPVPDLHGALAAGLVVATIVVGFGHISGAHINPAVTVSLLVANETNILRAFFYIGAQLLGAIAASSLLRSLAPPLAQANLGMTMVTEGISVTQAFVVEFIITFMLCYTVHAVCDKRRDDIGGSKALAVGLVVVVGCLFGGPYTGASMNPARSFGPAAVMDSWENHWIYWLGPMTGSIAAALIYTRILKKPSPIVILSDSHLRLNTNQL